MASSMAQAEPTVNGNEISWPDDGWYQVQSSDGATTLCGGGSSCTVPAGSYLVINHTTGVRYTDVQVSGTASNDGIVVSQNTISWPDDGWYQVQTANGSKSLCNGGTYCDVDPGNYLVINHTTGARFTNIVVSGDSPVVDTPVSATINRDNHIEILSEVFSVYTGNVYGDTLPRKPEDFMLERSPVHLEVTEEMQNGHEDAFLLQFTCNNGGTMELFSTSGEFESSAATYTWHDCLEGSLVHDGTLYANYGNSNTGENRDLVSADYNSLYSTGETVEISGEFGGLVDWDDGSDIIRIEHWANSEVDYSFQDATLVVEVSGANTDTQYTWLEQDDNVFTAELSGSFQLNSPLTEGQAVDVATTEPLSTTYTLDGPFEYYTGFAQHPAWTFTDGALEMTAEDGSALRLRADSGDEQTAEISLLQDGVVIETFQQPWSLWQGVLTEVQDDVRNF
ncbi:hypothetical protein [Granulosicoccus antarcticus]|nr:hypothetical protein [Granulosicoccus antarcticus]